MGFKDAVYHPTAEEHPLLKVSRMATQHPGIGALTSFDGDGKLAIGGERFNQAILPSYTVGELLEAGPGKFYVPNHILKEGTKVHNRQAYAGASIDQSIDLPGTYRAATILKEKAILHVERMPHGTSIQVEIEGNLAEAKKDKAPVAKFGIDMVG